MLIYIIDGNNLIGKIPSLMKIQNADKQLSREKLVHFVDRYFADKKSNVTIHFDGHPNTKINSLKCKIIYSENQTADDKIKKQISQSKSPRNIVVITSDSNLSQFARKCSCTIISSDNFAADITDQNKNQNEQSIIDSMNNIDEFKKLFGAD